MKLFRTADLLQDPTPVPSPERFTGAAFSSDIHGGPTSKATTALIRLDPGVRGHWHIHADGQVVHVVSGSGFVGRRDEEPLQVTAGDTVWIEPGEEHWHGASGEGLAQLAFSFGAITWLEPST
ncbi:cupin domain-containing protein [Actinomadura sp. 7K534]|uniref:cupin domain-containing protein n=1 Tax=Actinomadura sp. 7K534 TaxID=2530366 RepID=UPI0010527DD5|nr:cupin domain-containing protein [Actinomadura sp. 7K534]TDB97952.1 cupin domain-containing protein [Actinomadura sp. 7K534]